jgi:hypothetical protein
VARLAYQLNGGTVKRPLLKHPRYSRIATAHEYGHILFWENTREALGEMYQDYQRTLGEGGRISQHFNQRQRVAYDELFGDLVAVLYEGDPLAMVKVTRYAGMKQEIAAFRDVFDADARQHLAPSFPAYRAYFRKHDLSGRRIPVSGWNRPYATLGKVRSYLGKHVLRQAGFTRAEIMETVLVACREELVEQWADRASGPLDPELANDRLIERLSRRFDGIATRRRAGAGGT